MPVIKRRRSKRALSESEDEMPSTRQLRKTKTISYAGCEEAEQPPARPSRILASNRIKKAEVQDFNNNASDSRLLKLPAEIRERIYKYALGGNAIHMWATTRRRKKQVEKRDQRLKLQPSDEQDSDLESEMYSDYGNNMDTDSSDNDEDGFEIPMEKKMQLCYSICCRRKTDEDDIKDIKAESDFNRSRAHRTWERCHTNCRFNFRTSKQVPRYLDLSLLLVCRQTHGEAALLPFQENTFVFQTFLSLGTFIHNLIPSQLHAVQHLIVAYSNGSSRMLDSSIETKVKTSIRSLKTLNIILESDYEWTEHVDRANSFADLMQLKKLALEKVTVQSRVVDRGFFDRGQLTLAQMERYASDLEEMLKKEWVKKSKSELMEMREEAKEKFGFADKWT